MIKEVRKLMNKLNHVFRDWKEIGAKNNAVKSIENQLKNFYQRIGKKPKHPDEFATKLHLTDDQAEELEQIAMSAVNKDIYFEDWEDLFEGVDPDDISDKGIKSFESLKGQFGIENYQDFIDHYEMMNRFKNDKFLASMLSSEEYAELVTFAEQNNIQDPEAYVRNNAVFMYNLDGMKGADLYSFIHDSIEWEAEKAAAERESWVDDLI